MIVIIREINWKLFWKRLHHSLTGHPRSELDWGETEAICECGARFSLADLYPFM